MHRDRHASLCRCKDRDLETDDQRTAQKDTTDKQTERQTVSHGPDATEMRRDISRLPYLLDKGTRLTQPGHATTSTVAH